MWQDRCVGMPKKTNQHLTMVDLILENTIKDENVLAVDFVDGKLIQLDLTSIRGAISSYSLPIR